MTAHAQRSLQGWWLTREPKRDGRQPQLDAVFVLGGALWAAGAAVNLHSDHVLRMLRTAGETGADQHALCEQPSALFLSSAG